MKDELDSFFNSPDKKQQFLQYLIAKSFEQDFKDQGFNPDVTNFLELLKDKRVNQPNFLQLNNPNTLDDRMVRGFNIVYPNEDISYFKYLLEQNRTPVRSPADFLKPETYQDALYYSDLANPEEPSFITDDNAGISSKFTGSKPNIPSYVPMNVADIPNEEWNKKDKDRYLKLMYKNLDKDEFAELGLHYME